MQMQFLVPPASPSPQPHLLLQDLWRSLISPFSCLLLPCWQLLLREEYPAQPELGSHCCCCCPAAPRALLSFRCAPLHFVCAIVNGEPFQASLVASVMQAPLASWDIHFPRSPASNQWIPEILLSALLSTFLLVICLQFYSAVSTSRHPPAPLCLCRSQHRLVPQGWSALSTVLSWLYPQLPLLLQASGLSSTVMPVAADSLSVSLPWGLDFATHWSLAELVFCPWEDCCKSMVFPSRHLFLSMQFLLLALYCHSCLSLVL